VRRGASAAGAEFRGDRWALPIPVLVGMHRDQFSAHTVAQPVIRFRLLKARLTTTACKPVRLLPAYIANVCKRLTTS
jgi:hypothetical protein